MVSFTTLEKKSVTELENIRKYNNKKAKELLREIEMIDTILKEKSQDEVVKDGIYLVDGNQSVIAEVVNGKVYQVYDATDDFRINRQIMVRFEKGEMVCQLKGKKRKLNFVISRNSGFVMTNAVADILVRGKNNDYVDGIVNKFNKFLDYQTQNKEIIEIKEVFNHALITLNTELDANYTFNVDSLFKFLDLNFVKNLVDNQNVSEKMIDKVLRLIYVITFLNRDVFASSLVSLEENLKRYEKKMNKTNYKTLLKDIVKIPEVNL